MKEKTLVLIQRDAIERGLIGEIISRFEKSGLTITAIKTVWPTKEMAEKQYRATDEQIIGMGKKTLSSMTIEQAKKVFGSDDSRKIGEMTLSWAREYITKGILIAMVLEGETAIEKVRKIVGATDPPKAEKGTIRGDFGIDSISKANREKRKLLNLVHAAGSKEDAEIELKLWFPELK